MYYERHWYGYGKERQANQAALGSHLVFAMEVNGERVDPTKKLEK